MNQENIVYSTDPNFSLSSDIVESESILNDNQNLRVHLDREKRRQDCYDYKRLSGTYI